MPISKTEYEALYQQSIQDPNTFWAIQAEKFLTWATPWKMVKKGSFDSLDIEWFLGGELNASYNCIDRHLANRQEQVAVIWQGDEPGQIKKITYAELHENVCRFANVLKKYGVKKGDRVCIYLPMIPEIVITVLACARIGAIHSVVFSAFSADALKTRILDANCGVLITSDESIRGGKIHPLKINVDKALEKCSSVKDVFVVKRTGSKIPWHAERDHWFHDELQKVSVDCPPEKMDSNDPLFILYTSGSTGKPKGILHATAGYLLYVAMTFKYLFDYQEGDIHWCTADVGWITGHSYLIYGPLLNGATTLLFEGVPHYPTFSRFWETVDKHQVNIFYTAPTAIRALRKEGDAWVEKTSRKSLKLLGSVGEPINPEAWEWYYNVVGEKRCPIIDTWWQTETGGILISPFPHITPLKPGSAAWPFFGIVPEVVNDQGKKLNFDEMGTLVIKQPWPGFMKTIYGDHDRFVTQYFKKIPGNYLTGDSAYCDADHYFWITGREDDVIKVSGHRIGTGELESVIVSHPAISEAAVVAIPHDIKGNSIIAFVTTKSSITPNDTIKKELIKKIRDEIGAFAAPEAIQWARDLPKTRSGKIMRRLLRKIAAHETDNLGDLSTLSDANIVNDLISLVEKT